MSTAASPGDISRRAFVTSLLATGALASGGGAVLGRGGLTAASSASSGAPASEEYPLVVEASPLALRSGDLLVTDQSSGTIVHVRAGRAEEAVHLRSWSNSFAFDAIATASMRRMWISLTGLNVPGESYYFGVRGVGRILEVDTDSGQLVRVFASPDMVDPAGLALSADGARLLVADFNSFGPDGQLLSIDLSDGHVTTVSRGGHLSNPVGISLDGPNHVVLGVAEMPEVGTDGGRLLRVALSDGRQEVIHEHPKGKGELIGALSLPDGSYAAVRSEWPDQEQSALLVTGGGTGYRELHAPRPGFMSSGLAWSGAGIWVAESTRRQLHHVSLQGQLLETVDVPGKRSGPKLQRASSTLESVRLVA